MNTRLWMTDSKAKLWRQSAGLPYGAGQTVYGATMVEKDGRAFIMGGFKDKVGLKLLCRKILSIAILMKVTVRLTYIHLQNNSSEPEFGCRRIMKVESFQDNTDAAENSDKIYEFVPGSGRFREVAKDVGRLGGITAVAIPENEDRT